jgi:hypothetical protein
MLFRAIYHTPVSLFLFDYFKIEQLQFDKKIDTKEK